MSDLNLNLVNNFILRKQHLTDDSKIDDVIKIVNDVGGLHATIPKTPYLSIFSRAKNFTRKKLDEELYAKRSLGKIRCVRKTVYIIPKQMIPIAYSATKKMVKLTSERYSRYLGVSQKEYVKMSKLVLEVLKGGGMTAKEVKNELMTELNISAILNLMSDQGLLIRGNPKKGWKSNIHTYYPFHDYFPDIDLNEPNEAQAVALLVQYYLSSFGPVTEKDIIWWTGLKKTAIQEALKKIKEQIVRVEIEGLEDGFIMLQSDSFLEKITPPKNRVVNLLPALDSYIMGYKQRERYLSYQHYDRVFDRSGNATSTILLDGRIAGVWDFKEAKKPVVKILLFEDAEDSVLTEIRSKAQKIGRFIADKEVQINECDSMIPLPRRTAGGFMSPLRDS
ncbi:MAG: AlkZ family DNA glycosylase [Candidatus Bathyarchaeum sp.]|nr:MAG: AlkZ family DNA glycosylase [Candidatus Bathyarchaeum sp.]